MWLIAVPVVVLLLVLLVFMGRGTSYPTTTTGSNRVIGPPPGRGKHKPRGSVYMPMILGAVTVDLQPKTHETIHVAIGGRSRLGKTTSVLSLLDLPCGVLVIALDNTRPITERIREIGGIEWTNEPDWPVGINLLAGPARIVSEVLVEGWAAKTAGDTGKWRDIASDRMLMALEAMDHQGIPRNFDDLTKALWAKSADGDIDRACRDWGGRLMRLARSMGTSLGSNSPDDLDLVTAMRNHQKVLLRVNQYLNPRSAQMLSGMLLVHARRAAQEANTPFVIIVEEAGQMSDYKNEIIPLAQASADRGVPLVVITQNLSLLPLEVANNISVWISFSQEDKRELNFSAHKLRLEPEHLYIENFPGKAEQQGRGWCYVRAPGVSTRLVHVQLPKKPKQKILPAPTSPARRSHPGWEIIPEPVAMDGWRPWTPALGDGTIPTLEPDTAPSWVGTDKDMLRMWGQVERSGRETILWSPARGVWYDRRGCLEWRGGLTTPSNGKPSRPRSTMNDRDVTPYREFYRRAIGPPDPTVDHCCDNPICCDPDHMITASIDDNNANNEPRRLAFELAGWEKEVYERVVNKNGKIVKLHRWVQPAMAA